MNEDTLVTVLMPCYNSARYLHEAVNSVLNQTYRNIELLLIDDGSKDDTKKIIEEYARSDSRVMPHYNEVNLGLIKTLNKGIGLARGEFVARMDSDDISGLKRIETFIREFKARPDVDVISAGFYYISESGKILRRIYPKALSSQALKFVSFFCTPVNHPCSMIRTRLLRENQFNEQFIHSEDYEIFSRFLLDGRKVINLEEPHYFLRINLQSVSFKYETIQISTHTEISARNIERYFNLRNDYFVHKVMINRISFNVSPAMLKMAFRLLEELEKEYIAREKCQEKIIQEIDDFLTEQKIDIYFQSVKYAKWINKVQISFLILKSLRIFLSRRGRQYLRSKFYLFGEKPPGPKRLLSPSISVV